MTNIFESNRTYMLGDPELEVLGSREKLAQWRHRNVGPAFIRIGRRIAYHGADLNAWLNARRIDPSNEAA
ncbi:hypothetical protein ROA7450_01558 [Roseovarius albus]|uniref:MerR family transcriptional regulator n=1 Tax=Roseovarius albus TaxID=1247867 RepID=A0A1X6YXV5_9RHOB|nr:DNA-binding protein [Roseovarius albus]SLN34513.1 hypothetical protein ROA7450_01558 [Roseovarius albus]